MKADIITSKSVISIFFDIALFSFFFYSILSASDNMVFFPNFGNAFYLLSVLSSLLSMISNLKYDSIVRINIFVSLIIFSLYFHFGLGYRIMPNILLIIAASHIQVNHIMRVLLFSTAFCMLFMLLMVSLGLVNNYIMARDFMSGSSYNLGFQHYSGFSLRFIALFYLFLYVNRNKLTWVKIIFISSISLIVFLFTVTRLQLLSCLAILVLYILQFKFHIINFKKSIYRYISLLIYPLAIIFYYLVLTVSFIIDNDYFEVINTGVNGRLDFTVLAFEKYNVTLFGQVIEMVGAREAEGAFGNYFYIDSGYIYWLLALGLIFFTFILLSYIVIIYRSYKYQNFGVFAIMTVMAFANLSNDFFTTFFMGFPLIILLFADFNNNSNIFLNKRYGYRLSFNS